MQHLLEVLQCTYFADAVVFEDSIGVSVTTIGGNERGWWRSQHCTFLFAVGAWAGVWGIGDGQVTPGAHVVAWPGRYPLPDLLEVDGKAYNLFVWLINH
jgi:hypothetical protein